MPKKRKKSTRRISKNMIILLIVIVVVVIMVAIFALWDKYAPGGETKKSNDILSQTSSNIYTEVKNGSTIFSVTNECYWSGTDVRCKGEVKDTDTKPHTTGDIYVDLIAFDNIEKCGYCNSRKNMGAFTSGEIKTYSLVCDIGKKVDILAKITVSARASEIYKGC